MSRFLVHIHTGPEGPNKATLGCLVALEAARKGHDVTLFFAADGVHLLAPQHAGIEGQGTGRLGEHLVAALAARVGGARLEAEDGAKHHHRVVLRQTYEM